MTGTVQIHRVRRTTPEVVYKAFLDADALHPLQATHGHASGGEYLELLPFERIHYNNSFDDPQLPGEMRVTVSLRQLVCGTDVSIVQQGIPSVIPLEMCCLGWQESMLQLANLVEPWIPG